MIARVWPVAGVVGENGGFYFRYHQNKMIRHFVFDSHTQAQNRKKLDSLQKQILAEVPGSAVASDQFCRLMDLAIDFCEDVPRLPQNEVQKIVSLFTAAGAHAKISSIHVNGWFGQYDKLSQSLNFLKTEFGLSPEEAKKVCAFAGDSPNDESMFEYFPHSFAVANILHFVDQIQHKPGYVADLVPRSIPTAMRRSCGLGDWPGSERLPKALIYGPTKAAIINLCEALYLDLRPRGIAVYMINPGFVKTPLTAGNDFKMPALISAQEAAAALVTGLAKGAFHIHFPKRFTNWLRFARLLPYRWYFALIHRVTGL